MNTKMETKTQPERTILTIKEEKFGDPGFTHEKIIEEVKYRISRETDEGKILEGVQLIFRKG